MKKPPYPAIIPRPRRLVKRKDHGVFRSAQCGTIFSAGYTDFALHKARFLC